MSILGGRLNRRRDRDREGARFRYSAWDGTQVGFEMDAEALFGELTDDLLYHGDLNAALRRLMQQGMTDADGNELVGLREMLERLREQREERLERFDLGGIYDDIKDELDDIVEDERDAIADHLDDAKASGDNRLSEIAERSMQDKNLQLDLMPPDLAGKVSSLSNYEFVSPEARERFDELTEQLRQEIAESYFNQMAGAMESVTPEDLQRMKDMMAELNQMLEAHQRGEETDFDGFMDKYGDFFPENPQSIEELLEIMAQRMAAMQAMMNSMSPEQRQQLQELMGQLMDDMDLQFQAQQLGQNLQQMFPQMGWDSRQEFSGDEQMGIGQASSVMQELGELDSLQQLLGQASTPGALADIDFDRVSELLDKESAESLQRMAQMARMLEESGLVENKDGRLELTPRAIRKIGSNALAELFHKLTSDKLGKHKIDKVGIGHERAYTTKEYEFGDPFNLNIEQTVRNAIRRTGGGTPVQLSPEDFEIERTEMTTSASTVLMLDLSLSMPMRDNFLPAKKVTMALHSLITSQYPRDYMGIVGFAESARELTAGELPEVSWDFAYGTNMQHGFMIARRLLAGQSGTKQIIMITDGEPTAHLMANGGVYFNYPPVQETIDATMKEVVRCTKDGIRINTFMLDPDGGLRRFIEQLSAYNGGRAFFTTPDNLGDYVLVDFVEHRRKLLQGRARL
ncbi:MAG: hypothetical protein GY708_08180 [Actinomycetia bacterium]|nr:hypothetical protein [Actinomycetes bacterium]MCP4961886.1 hypothetical protein [Actinomycetes bacterium]